MTLESRAFIDPAGHNASYCCGGCSMTWSCAFGLPAGPAAACGSRDRSFADCLRPLMHPQSLRASGPGNVLQEKPRFKYFFTQAISAALRSSATPRKLHMLSLCRHGPGKWQAITNDPDPAIGGALYRRSNVDLKVGHTH